MYPIYEILFVYLYIDSFFLIMDTKICTKCGKTLPLDAFNKGNGRFGRRTYCRECEHVIQNSEEAKARRRLYRQQMREDPEWAQRERRNDAIRRHTNKRSILLSLLRTAKQRAKMKGLEFSITEHDLSLPDACPLLGIPLKSAWGKATPDSYSIDRIDSSKGYIPGNVWVISKRANMIKSDATLEELELLVTNLRNCLRK